MDEQSPPTVVGIAPLAFAIGIAVVLVGLIVNPLVISPLGGANTHVSGFAWTRRNGPTPRPPIVPPAQASEGGTDELYSRSRFLERATLALGGLVALACGWLAPAPWLLALLLVAILSALWFFAVAWLIRTGEWGSAGGG
jgi:hypothetical protein